MKLLKNLNILIALFFSHDFTGSKHTKIGILENRLLPKV